MTLPSGAPFASRLLERTLAALCDGGLEEEALRLMCAPRQGCPVSLPCEADWLVACTEEGHGVSSKRLSAWPRLDAIGDADAKGAACRQWRHWQQGRNDVFICQGGCAKKFAL